jgi:hypothetical protein
MTAALALTGALATTASADVRLLPVSGTTQTSSGAVVALNGIAVTATCRFSPIDPCQPITTPVVNACRNLTPVDPCRALNRALAALGHVQPGHACLSQDPCRVITALAAEVTTPTARCAAVGVQSTIRTTGEVLVNTTNPILIPSDPCRLLGSVPVGYRIAINANGSIGDARARPGTVSVDLPPVLG